MKTENSQTAIKSLREIGIENKARKKLGLNACIELESNMDLLTDAIRGGSGQGVRIENIMRSLWNGELCDNLCGLDNKLIFPVLSAIQARASLEGDADNILRRILTKSEIID